MGVNVVAMAAPLICGWPGQRVDWHLGFAAAGVGMTLGLVQYVIGRGWLEAPRTKTRESSSHIEPPATFTTEEWKRVIVILVLFLFAILFWARSNNRDRA